MAEQETVLDDQDMVDRLTRLGLTDYAAKLDVIRSCNAAAIAKRLSNGAAMEKSGAGRFRLGAAAVRKPAHGISCQVPPLRARSSGTL